MLDLSCKSLAALLVLYTIKLKDYQIKKKKLQILYPFYLNHWYLPGLGLW